MSGKISDFTTSEAVGKEIAYRIKQCRILSGVTQEELADKAMISVRTLKRFESGEDISFVKFLRILKAMELDGGLEQLVPDPSLRPSLHTTDYKPRKRVVRKKESKSDWKWGDEQ